MRSIFSTKKTSLGFQTEKLSRFTARTRSCCFQDLYWKETRVHEPSAPFYLGVNHTTNRKLQWFKPKHTLLSKQQNNKVQRRQQRAIHGCHVLRRKFTIDINTSSSSTKAHKKTNLLTNKTHVWLFKRRRQSTFDIKRVPFYLVYSWMNAYKKLILWYEIVMLLSLVHSVQHFILLFQALI